MMTRVYKYLACLISFVCIILLGCVNEEGLFVNTDHSEAYTTTESSKESSHQQLQTNVLMQKSLGVSVGEQLSLPALGLKDMVVVAKETSISANKLYEGSFVYLLGDYRYQHDTFHDAYIALEVENKVLFYDLGNRSLEDEIYLCDLNADGNDEIVLHQVVDQVGGGGQHVSRIFCVEENGIVEMLYAEPDSTGYRCEALADKQFSVYNTFTNDSYDINISNLYPGEYFDDTGKLTEKIEISYGSFLKFSPKDVDGDGVFEMECVQLLYFDKHRNFVGYARSIMKFNTETQQFDVIQAEYYESWDSVF